MANLVKARLGEREVDALEVDFQTAREEWNDYHLLDGGRVRVKTVVAKILWVVDEAGNRLYNDQGEPIILVRNQVQVISSQ